MSNALIDLVDICEVEDTEQRNFTEQQKKAFRILKSRCAHLRKAVEEKFEVENFGNLQFLGADRAPMVIGDGDLLEIPEGATLVDDCDFIRF